MALWNELRAVLALSFLLILGVAVGCGAAPPPKELRDARTAFERAQQGSAAKLAPAELDTAKQALNKAEEAFADEPEVQSTLDLAYIAERRALLAEARAAVRQAEQLRTGAEKTYKNATEEELANARKQLESGQKELEAERRARQEAERRAKAAMESLAKVAAVKEESRGVVITLSGAVLFASGKSALLPIAKDKLNDVATALKDQGNPTIVVEGHTDATGSRRMNMNLSQRRAEAVRTHLISRGIPASQIKAVGVGPDRPVADNRSADGRANNRRVEIIVNP
ncbi:MAG: OmpA family protein [Deltaproteobacteria bacterium]|jgi:outer membrane protein OmpA-like peptidoglycan-associated protein|nr:OmpA family protein [Deltaproteobacteria bacterium]MBW2531628.1 OmpA family protein [Deltaproteobacteria bacterium]